MFHASAQPGGIHVPHQWEYDDAAALAAGLAGMGAADNYKLAIQKDTNALWLLTNADTSPAWTQIASKTPSFERLTIPQPEITDNAPAFQVSTAWNDGADTFRAWTLDVTDTASAADSQLLRMRVNGSEKFSVRKDGRVTATERITGTQFYADDSKFYWNGSILYAQNTSPLDHDIAQFVGDKSQVLAIRNKDFHQYLAWRTNGKTDWSLGRFDADKWGIARGSTTGMTDALYVLDGTSEFTMTSGFVVRLQSTQAATDTTSGALSAVGGISTQNNIHAAGNLNVPIINPNQTTRFGGGTTLGTWVVTIQGGGGDDEMLRMQRDNALGGGFAWRAGSGDTKALWTQTGWGTVRACISSRNYSNELWIGTGDLNKSIQTYINSDNDWEFRRKVIMAGTLHSTGHKSGADQATAGAAAEEVWVTSGHATLPDGVMMLGL